MLRRAPAAQDGDPHGVVPVPPSVVVGVVVGPARGRPGARLGAARLELADGDRDLRALVGLAARGVLVEHDAVALLVVDDPLLRDAPRSPRPDSRWVATSWVSPVMSGTSTWVGALATVRSTAAPLAPGPGRRALAEHGPGILVGGLLARDRPPAKPASSSVARASSSLWPTTDGSATCCGPVDTVSSTVSPTLAWLPCAGLAEITRPDFTVSLDSSVRHLEAGLAQALRAPTCRSGPPRSARSGSRGRRRPSGSPSSPCRPSRRPAGPGPARSPCPSRTSG